jgi:hypothetical protein
MATLLQKQQMRPFGDDIVSLYWGIDCCFEEPGSIRTGGAAYVRLDGGVLRASIGLAHRRDNASAVVRTFIAVARRRRRVQKPR